MGAKVLSALQDWELRLVSVTVKHKASSCNCNTVTIERDIMDLFFHACGFSIPDNSIFICFHWEFKVTESNQMEVVSFVYAER